MHSGRKRQAKYTLTREQEVSSSGYIILPGKEVDTLSIWRHAHRSIRRTSKYMAILWKFISWLQICFDSISNILIKFLEWHMRNEWNHNIKSTCYVFANDCTILLPYKDIGFYPILVFYGSSVLYILRIPMRIRHNWN